MNKLKLTLLISKKIKNNIILDLAVFKIFDLICLYTFRSNTQRICVYDVKDTNNQCIVARNYSMNVEDLCL